MERMLRLRMISLVSILMVVSMFCSMVTDVQFYIDKLRDKHSTFKGENTYQQLHNSFGDCITVLIVFIQNQKLLNVDKPLHP